MMGYLLNHRLYQAVYFLTVCVLYTEQRWDDDIGMPLEGPPPGLQDSYHRDNEEYEELFFYKRSYADFIEGMRERKMINNSKVADVFYNVRRADFINCKPKYGFGNMPFAFDHQVVMEPPSYIAMCLEHIVDHIHNGSRVLDIGSGQGYMATGLAHLVHPHGKVYALEHDPLTVNNSLKNIRIARPDLLKNKTLEILVKDGRWGYEEGGPYDLIFFGGAVVEVSQKIISQLKPNGRIIAPIGTPWRQNLTIIDKRPDGSIASTFVKRVTKDFLVSLTFQLHPEEFYKPDNISSEVGRQRWWPPPPGVRPRDHSPPMIEFDSMADTGTTLFTTKYMYIPDSIDDKYIFDQDVLDVIHGPNKTISKRKKAKIMWERI